uniref:Lysozyme 1 n=1 Tax=Meloidogyne artiellia TaxID=42426 RepID=A5H466_MELAT|nr:lysozyme 1 [Meloidogyne artiellia]ABN58659.1 lysozyme 1 [Meloidogyne artiellia]
MKYFLLLLFICGVSSKKGFDGIQAISQSTFDCLKKNGYDFFIARIWQEVNNYDETGIANIKHARAAGWTDVDGYIYPCTKSSCPSGQAQVEAALNRLKTEGAKINTLWMDIEGTWPSDTKHNQQFIEGMVSAAKKAGVKTGIYSGQYSWPQIVGNWNGMDGEPLWWPNYNGHENNDNFPHYGGWTKATMHQYKGTTLGPCGVSMDLNYKP